MHRQVDFSSTSAAVFLAAPCPTPGKTTSQKSGLFSFFSTADAADGGQERARLVGLEPGRDIGQVVALAEQNAIDLVPAPCLAAHLRKQTIRGIAAEGQTEAL